MRIFSKVEIVWGEGNTEVYFRNPLNLIDIPHDFYIKGHTVGNQGIIALPRLISTSGETDKYIWIMRYDSTSKTHVKDTEKSSVTFDIDSDGTLRLADQSELLALGDKNGNWLKPNSIPELRFPPVISSVTYSPVNTNPILPPADAKIESWRMTSLMKEGLSHDTSVNVQSPTTASTYREFPFNIPMHGLKELFSTTATLFKSRLHSLRMLVGMKTAMS